MAVRRAQDYYPDCPEPFLVSLARAGDRSAFEELVRRRQSQVRNLMRRFCNDPVLADDLAQQVLMKVWLNIRQLKKSGAFDAWLRKLSDGLLREKIPASSGGDFDPWDIQVRGGLFGSARLQLVVEEHGGGRQLLRYRIYSYFNPWGVILILLAGVLARHPVERPVDLLRPTAMIAVPWLLVFVLATAVFFVVRLAPGDPLGELRLDFGHPAAHRDDRVGVERYRFDTVFHQPLGDLGEVGGGLAAYSHILAVAVAGLDRHLHQFEHRLTDGFPVGDAVQQ